ncbi:MAG: mechanosensitive ion channel [Candidatus Omnitrophica bacterium]|nr:mechanosensitive ion channel [Candidatus Omnitrophota bacterium]MDD5652916.1 mechanosensitive ion channel [Candidatus Omnitrophota bacterium]
MQVDWDKIAGYAVQFGMSFIAAVLIFVIGKWVARIISQVIEKAMEKGKVHKTLASFTKNIVYYTILIFVAIAALNKIGIETNSFVALVGAAGLAVGFALQGSLANFAAGVMIILFQPFEVGDTIEAAGATGKVEEIQMFNIVLSAEDKRIIIPNAKITSDKVTISLKNRAKK